MQALSAYNVGMVKHADKKAQYTVRNVPPQVDRSLRRLAEERRMSLNGFLLQTLREIGSPGKADRQTFEDLDFLIGSWVEDPVFDQAIEEQRSIDADLWK